MERRFKVARVFTDVFLALSTLLVGTVFYWSFHDYNVIVPAAQVYKLNQYEYTPGEQLKFHVDFCKNGKYPVVIDRVLVDGVSYHLKPVRLNIGAGCHSIDVGEGEPTENSIIIPNIPAGKYVYREILTYKVNPIREVSYQFETEQFEVIN